MGIKPLWNPRALALPAALVLVVAAACSGSKTENGNPSTGATSGWTFLPPGTGSAGTPASAGAGGATAGGGGAAAAAGSAGMAGVGGSSVRVPKPFGCNGLVPNQPLITQFHGFMKDRWVSPGNLNGGIYVYPEPLTVKDGDFLRFADKVTTYSGIGVWFSGCINASSFAGVRFTVSGTIPPGRLLRMYAISNRNRDIDEEVSVGACLASDPLDPWSSCRPPGLVLPVTVDAGTQSVPWTAFKNGLPSPTTDGSDILALQWSFDWADGFDPYDAQLTIDDLEFYKDGPDPGGAGGEGGQDGQGGAGPTNDGGVGGT